MDPNSGRIYSTVVAAKLAGVPNPVEVIGQPQDIQRLSDAVKAQHRAERKSRNKAAKKSRRKNRN